MKRSRAGVRTGVRQRLITNEFCFKDKTLHKFKNGFTLSLNSVANPTTRNNSSSSYRNRVTSQNCSSNPSVIISESEITELADTILKDLARAVGELNNNGPDALKVEQYKMWARQNPRKESPYYKPADVTAGSGDTTVEPGHPLENTLKRKRTE